MRLVQVGAGSWGKTWLPVVQASGWELAAIADTDAAALARAGEAVGLSGDRLFGSLADAIGTIEADAALVAVPPRAHAAVAVEAIEGGLHCLVEKPFAPTLAEARTVVEAAEAAGRTVMVSQNFRFTRGADTVRELLGAGRIGELGAVNVRFAQHPVGGYRLTMEEPLLLDMAIHHFDSLRGTLGLEPSRVLAASFNPPWSPYARGAYATVALETQNGAAATYTGSWATRGPVTPWEGDWEIEGTDGWIRWRGDEVTLGSAAGRGSGLLGRARGRPRRVRGRAPAAEQRAGCLAELTAALREGREPEASGRDNLRTLAVTLAAVESAKTGRAVTPAD
jgi:predicted dehydrogenase